MKKDDSKNAGANVLIPGHRCYRCNYEWEPNNIDKLSVKLGKNMKCLIIISFISILIFVSCSKPEDTTEMFNRDKYLRDYAGTTFIASQISHSGPNGVISGDNLTQNREMVSENLNCIQPSVYPAWGGFWPLEEPPNISEITFETKALDDLVNWSLENNLEVIHHCLIFPNCYYPNWFWSSDYSSQELDNLLVDFIESVLNANDNKNKVYAWNLINEIFKEDGTYRTYGNSKLDCKWNRIGKELDVSGLTGDAKINDTHPLFIRKTFETASLNTNAKLEIRDYDIAFGGTKADAMYQLVKHLINSGVKIDAVGFQCHLDYNIVYDYSLLKSNIERFIDLGIDVYVTELDVGLPWGSDPFQMSPSEWDTFAEKQKDIYYNLTKAARESNVKLISTWGFRDGSMGSWRENHRAWLLN